MMADPVRVRGGFTQATLSLMQGLVNAWSHHPFFVQVAREIVNRADARTPLQEAEAIWRWVKGAVRFRLDPVGAEWVQDPWETAVKSKAGDCDDFAVLTGTLLQAIGHPVSMAAVRWVGRDDYSHATTVDRVTGAIVDPMPSANVFNDPQMRNRIERIFLSE